MNPDLRGDEDIDLGIVVNLAEDQETACRDYCSDRQFTVAAVYAAPTGSTDNYDELLALATSPEAPFDAIVVWKTSRIVVSLKETISLRDLLRRAGAKFFSVTEKSFDE